VSKQRHWHLWALATLTLTGLLIVSPSLASPPQSQDYLTDEEIQKARETQEPNARILLFLEFAAARLARFQKALAASPPAQSDELTEMLDDYISAVDDTTSNLEIWLDRGGVNLEKARKQIEKQVPELLSTLEKLDTTYRARLAEFSFTWEDSLEATRELLEAAADIPAGMIPAKKPEAIVASPEEEKAAPGQPTLRKKEEQPKPPPPKPTPPLVVSSGVSLR